ncbi:MAG: family 20 glycosylhydrolase [Tannerellaceae bacterium]|nr:family 20 glycosylhydrolase [Tannerellaceae bacterium]
MKNMFFLSAFVALLLCFGCAESNLETKSYNQGVNIIPKPNMLVQNQGEFKLSNKTTLYADSPEAKTIAEFFAAKLRTSTGYAISVNDGNNSKGINLSINPGLDTNEEGYTLDVTSDAVHIQGKTAQGIFYAMQSFMQLLPAEVESPVQVNGIAWTAPAVTIKDEPRFGYRGMELDPCRHFMPLENVLKCLDVMAMFKLNRMHWHLTDDQGWRIEIKKYPKLTEVGSKRMEGEGYEYGGYYTQEEIKQVVQYAADRFITVIPEIEIPGHEMAAIAAYPELSCQGLPGTPRIIWGVEDIVLCAGKEEVFDFFEDVFVEVLDLFPSEYIHIGGDECPKDSWKVCPLCQKRIRELGIKRDKEHSAEEYLQSYFVQRVEKMLAKYGRKIIGWDEILEGGLAPTATVMSWRGEEGGIAAAYMGHDVIMTPASHMYIDHFQGDPKIEPVSIGGYLTLEKVYSYNPTPDTLVKAGKEHHILGAQCNTWSEYMYTEDIRDYRIFPRSIALAELNWTQLENKDYKDFERRINNAYVRLDAYDINYHIPQPEQPNGSSNFVAFTDKVSIPFKTTRPVKVVYTLDGSEPTPASTVYTEPIEFTESGTIKIRSILPSGKMSPVRTITVEKQALAPAKEVAKKSKGLKMDYTYGYYLRTADIPTDAVWKTITIPQLRNLTSVEKTTEGMRGVKQYSAIATGYIDIPEDGVYFFSSENEEVWIDGKLLIDNSGEVKRFSRKDSSVALAKGLHEIKVVFLGHIIGGWPSSWNNGGILIRKAENEKFTSVTGDMLFN